MSGECIGHNVKWFDDSEECPVCELADKNAVLDAERDEWKKRAERAAHIKKGDAVGFDWSVLEKIDALEAVAEAARDVIDAIGRPQIVYIGVRHKKYEATYADTGENPIEKLEAALKAVSK